MPGKAAAIPELPAGGSHRCDLRGLRADEAHDRFDETLDAAAAAGRERHEVVHGIGTGALRRLREERLLRELLAQLLHLWVHARNLLDYIRFTLYIESERRHLDGACAITIILRIKPERL